MLLTLCLVSAAIYALLHFLIWPIVQYWLDPKGLRRYPNYSTFSTISDWPLCFLSARGYRSRDLTELHKKLKAPILRIGPNNLSFAHVDAIRDIYGHSTTCVKDLKYTITAGPNPHLFDVVDKTEHGIKRKRLSAAFAIKNLVRWEDKVARTTSRLVAAFDRHCFEPSIKVTSNASSAGAVLDYNYWINLFTIEAINYICLSANLGLLENGNDTVTARSPEGVQYQASYRKAQDATAYAISHFVWDYDHYHWLVKLSKLVPSWRRVWTEAAPWMDIVNHQSITRLDRYKQGEDIDDFFTVLMKDKEGRELGLPWLEIVNEINAIINAGADTTSIALTQVLYFLLKNPQHLDTLRAELDGVLGPDDVVAPYQKVKQLPFLKACLDEGLRFVPPTSAGLPRRTPSEGAQILGEWIAGNTSVSMTAYAAHHDPNVFPKPEEYNPERWMDPNERKRMEPYFIPFSTGGRGCLGRNISYLEQHIVLATIVHRYDVVLAEPDFELSRFEAFNLQMGAMPIKLSKRFPDAVS